jgi:cell division septation protein DedD
MELTCPSCGAKNESDDDKGATGAQGSSCVACGESLGDVSEGARRVQRAREYDGYAVGRRVLKIAPIWLLLVITGFVLVWLFFSWARRPVGNAGASPREEFKNEATNQAPAPAHNARPSGADLKKPPAATPASGPAGFETAAPAASPGPASAQGEANAEEGSAFSVQVGAFADLSQANEQVSRLRAAGFEARVVESSAATRFHFQVRSGRFATREEAARLAAQLRAGGVAGETVIVEPESR